MIKYVTKRFRLLGLLLLTGCTTLGPDYIEPQLNLPRQWHNVSSDSTGERPLELAAWWRILDDPILTDLIQKASDGNLDVKEGLSRIRQARLQRLKSGADRYPTLDSGASAKKSYIWDEDDNQTGTELYSVGFDADWEVDLFGGTQRSLEAAQADLEAVIENLNHVWVTLLSEVALNYIDTRTYQARLVVAKSNVAAQEETYELVQALFQAGREDELAVAQARYNLENSRATLPDLEAGLEEAMNRLAVLTGHPAGTLHDMLSPAAPIPEVSLDIAVGAPADIILQRPDIRQAERELAAQTARIGAAEAERYPSLTIGGSLCLESLTLGDLFSAPGRVASLGPTLSLPIFNGGTLKANVEIETEQRDQVLLAYRETVLTALEEVENALVALAKDQEKLVMRKRAVDSAREAADLAEIQFSTGLTDFNDILDAQRSLLSFEDQLIQNQGTLVADLVRLYKALGGGWQSFQNKG